MRNSRMISAEILQSIDVANTLGGGITEPRVILSQFPEYRQIELKVPGISSEDFHVRINNNQLVVYYNIRIIANEASIAIKQIVYNKQIPYFIDASNITAHYSHGTLVVQLPFNELANGYHRDIPIEN